MSTVDYIIIGIIIAVVIGMLFDNQRKKRPNSSGSSTPGPSVGSSGAGWIVTGWKKFWFGVGWSIRNLGWLAVGLAIAFWIFTKAEIAKDRYENPRYTGRVSAHQVQLRLDKENWKFCAVTGRRFTSDRISEKSSIAIKVQYKDGTSGEFVWSPYSTPPYVGQGVESLEFKLLPNQYGISQEMVVVSFGH